MRVISNEVLAVENGTDSATVFDYGEDKVCMKFQMEDGTILVKFFSGKELGSYPWSNVFRALDADNTDALLDRSVEITVSNNYNPRASWILKQYDHRYMLAINIEMKKLYFKMAIKKRH